MSEQRDPTVPAGVTAGVFSPDGAALRRRYRRALRQLGLCVLLLVPWTVYLGLSLPDRFEARYWPMVWVGFDVMLLTSLACAGVAVWLRRQVMVPMSYVAATLLICDAWFDVSLDWGRPDVWGSVVTAVLVELPLAALLIVRARRVLKVSARLAWQRLGLPGEPPPLHRMPLFVDFASGPGGNEAGSARGGRTSGP
ncbi:hypothetical protein SRB17_47720 [Streptomyces sp. RB17]|uniref:hypothetical protein n=1 Tax=Streptomyces sp. RB17 TaxID=2585197 RepID=UPI0012975C1C|nr:hypothetical protein [Streptomyces sp. RB17]MQY36770.1 hypothetical protein [Streptomyces sp. RB17]